MIKTLKRLVSWLESRFPERVVVTADDYARYAESLGRVVERAEALAFASTTIDARLAKVESDSVHKDAVKDLIAVVQALKNDVDALKNNLGWARPAEKAAELQAMLNGEVI